MRYLFRTVMLVFLNIVVLNFSIAETLKIGVVDIPLLVDEYSEVKGLQQELQDEFAEKDAVLKKISLDLQNAQTSLTDTNLIEDVRKENERNLLNLEREYARLIAEFRQDYNLRRNEELFKMHKEITDAILEFADSNDYDLILESGMIYANEKLQLTDMILNLLREKLKK